jgi:hypothetical protein
LILVAHMQDNALYQEEDSGSLLFLCSAK